MEEFILNNIDVHGPLAVFFLLMLSGVGIPLGEDIIIIPAGVFVGQGHLHLWPTLIASYFGVVCSDILWFIICSRYGSPLLHRRWFKRMIHPRRLLQIKHQIEKRGAWMIVMSRFIPASRTTAITTAGLMHMKLWKFALATAACVVITMPIQLGLGYLIAQGIGTQKKADLLLWVVGVMALFIAGSMAFAWWRQYRAKKQRIPRARVSWLKRYRAKRRPALHKRGLR